MHSFSFQCSAVLFAEPLLTFERHPSECELAGTLSLMMGVGVGGMWRLVPSSGMGSRDKEEGSEGNW